MRVGFDQNVTDLQLDSAEDAVAMLDIYIGYFSLLSHAKSLTYLVDKSRELVSTLKLQLRIIANIDTVLSTQGGETILTEETCETLNVAITDAESIRFEHASVTSARGSTKKFVAAKEAIVQIEALSKSLKASSERNEKKSGDGDNDHGAGDDDGSGSFEEEAGDKDELTSSQLAHILQCLGSYSDVLPGAVEALSVAQQKLDEIKVEMDTYVPQLTNALQSETLRVDKATGMVMVADALAARDPSPLTVALKEINPKKLKGKDCKVLYKGVLSF